MITPEQIIILVTAIWTIVQQYQINQMCKKCPFLPANQKEKKDITS
jgi:hypothetical protein